MPLGTPTLGYRDEAEAQDAIKTTTCAELAQAAKLLDLGKGEIFQNQVADGDFVRAESARDGPKAIVHVESEAVGPVWE